MVAHVLEGVVLIVPVPGHGLPWRLVVPPSLGARYRTPLRQDRKASPPPSSDNVLTAISAGRRAAPGGGEPPATDSQHYRRTKGRVTLNIALRSHRGPPSRRAFLLETFQPDCPARSVENNALKRYSKVCYTREGKALICFRMKSFLYIWMG